MDSTVNSPNMQRQTLSWLVEQGVVTQLTLLSHHLELTQLLVNEIMQSEVSELAGERYKREKPNDGRYSRWGYNPSSVRIGQEKVKVEVPRVYDNQKGESVPLEAQKQLKAIKAPSEQLLRSMLRGLSTRDHESVLGTMLESFGLSKSSVSKQFVEQSKKALEAFEQRDLSGYNFIAMYLDGKYMKGEQMLIALGVTEEGRKIPLGFIQATTENSTSIKDQLLEKLIERGFRYEEGFLVIIDGGKGIYKAVKEVFGPKALIQRCQWHKRENVVSYLKEEDQQKYRRDLNKAYREENHKEAKEKLLLIRDELKEINLSAARSLEEGLEETLTIHKLGMVEQFGRTFSTTNSIENLNSQLGKYMGKVKRWMDSEQRYRWMACALLEIEQRMRRVPNYKQLHLLKKAITKELQK